MKRNIALASIIALMLVLSLLFLPTGLAKKSDKLKSPPKNKTTVPLSLAELKVGALQRSSATPVMRRAVGFGVSRPVKQLAAEQARLNDTRSVQIRDHEEVIEQKLEQNAGPKKPRVYENGEEEAREKNPTNREIIRRVDATAKGTQDGALAHVPSNKGINPKPEVMPTPTVSFEAISLTDTTALPGQGFLPPDTIGEIGPNHFVQMVNSAFRIYDRTGTPLIALTSIKALFSTLPGPCASSEDGDPVVVYDQLADRWFLSEFCTIANPNSHQLIAISTTGDPTGSYFVYDFMMPNNKFNDYPKFGVWPDAYYMTDNQFNQAGTQFLGAGVFAFDRAKMILGNPAASFIYFDKADGCPGACQFGGMLPTDIDGFTPPPLGAPNSIIQFEDDQTGSPADQLRIFDFHADFATPANSTLTERTGSPLAVAAFDSREVPAGSRNVIPQPPPGVAVDAISDRLMFRLAYRNFGDHESLVVNHTVNAAVNPAFRAGVRYYELRKTTFAGAWAVQEQATMAGGVNDTENRWMGSTALNAAGSQAVGYSVSSASVFPSIRYAGRLSTDPAGGLAQGEATLVAGTSSQTHSSGRWGDYSDLTVDPVDDCTFWYTQEYVTGASSPDNTRWHTRVGSFQFGPCAPIQRGTIQGTITNCRTGLPISNALISITGGFLRTTDASGNYSATVPAGNYDATATAAGYDTASASNLVVPNDGSVTFTACLNGILKQPVADTASILEDSCNSNGVIDPLETVTVSLGIKNTGTLDTTNLVATLQATGGVTSPSGPQTYGVVIAGGPTVFRSFTFTAQNLACGAPLVITLQLQDGATDLGTVTYNFTLGQQAVALAENFDGVVAPALPAGWVAANAGGSAPLWVTSTTASDTTPNDAFVDDPVALSDKRLDTPDIAITSSSAQVIFRNNWNLEDTFDGGVLEVSSPNINAGAFTDITDAAVGGSFVSGGYTATISSSFMSPIAGRQAWTGTSSGYITTTANLGPNVVGQTIKLRFRMASDSSTSGAGWRIDTLLVSNGYVCCGSLIAASSPAPVSLESCPSNNGAIDPGETVTVTLPLVNNGTTPTSNLMATLQATGGVSTIYGTNPQDYGVVSMGGGAVSRTFRFTASGTCGGTLTATLALQDGARDLGTVTFTFPLGTVNTSSQTFSNPTAIVIPGTGTGATTGAPANPYPSNITVSGVPNPASAMTVTLTGLTHTFPSDVDVLLVGPSGQKFILLSDVIGGTDWDNINYTLDDAAATFISNAGSPVSGTFKPTNYSSCQDPFPASAPAGPYLSPGGVTGQTQCGTNTLTSTFGSLNPNGTWSLYVVDDASVDTGTIAGGWALTFTTSTPVCCAPSAAPATISGSIRTPDGIPVPGVTMRLAGAMASIAVTDIDGNYRFDNVETGNFYTVTPALANYRFSPVNRSFSLLGSTSDAIFTATPDSIATTNAIDSSEYFVRQQYIDFLGREPDQGGLSYWSAQLNGCGSDASCLRTRRVDVSAAFFVEQEFQLTGSYVFKLYKGALGRQVSYSEFAADRSQVVAGTNLDANKQAFADAFVQRPEFVQKYQANSTAESFVDALLETVRQSGGTDLGSERSRLIAKYSSASSLNGGRSLVIRDIAENTAFSQAVYNQAFVLMEYFGYLRREPEQGGYDFWLSVLDNRQQGNYRGMVCAFITSAEYQLRFSPVITHSNADCGR